MVTFLNNPDLTFILFGGKGGVGKTTCAAATALHFARREPERKILLVSTDPAHSLSDSLNLEVGDEETLIDGTGNLFALALNAEAIFEDWKEKHGAVVKTIIDRGTYLDKRDISNFFELSLPGLDEIMAIVKLIDVIKTAKYDLVIVDTAPTGHTVRLLALPEHMNRWVQVMDTMMDKHRFMFQRFAHRKYKPEAADHLIRDMRADVTRVRNLLRNPKTTEFVPVLIPEAMSIYETERLVTALREFKIPVRSVILNRLQAFSVCEFCRGREENQEKYQREIAEKFGQYRMLTVPLFSQEVRGIEGLTAFAKVLLDQDDSSIHPAQTTKVKASIEAGPPAASGLEKLLREDLRFLIFNGKGGVGKTTIASATALLMAKRRLEEKVLLISTDPAHSIADSFDCPIGDVVAPIRGIKNLYGIQLDAEQSLEDFKQQYKEEVAEAFDEMLMARGGNQDVVFDRKVIMESIDLTPQSFDEVMALTYILDLMREGQYGRFVLDTAPTGHLLRFLELPDLAREWFRAFFTMMIRDKQVFRLTSLERTIKSMIRMAKGMKEIQRQLTDSHGSEIVVVTIPEAMGLLESERLLASLHRMRIPCRQVIVNNVIPPTGCDFCEHKRQQQCGYIGTMRSTFSQYEIAELPLFSHELRGIDDLRHLGSIMVEAEKALPHHEKTASIAIRDGDDVLGQEKL